MKRLLNFITRVQKLKKYITENYVKVLIYIVSYFVYLLLLSGLLLRNYFNYWVFILFLLIISLTLFYTRLSETVKTFLNLPLSVILIILSHLTGGISGALKGIPYYLFLVAIRRTKYRISFFFLFLVAEIIPLALKNKIPGIIIPGLIFIAVSIFLIILLHSIENSIQEKNRRIDDLSSKLRFFDGLKLKKEEVFRGLKETPLPAEPYALLKRALNYLTEIYFSIYKPQTLLFLFYDRTKGGFRFEVGDSKVAKFSPSYIVFENAPLLSLGVRQKKSLFLSEVGSDGKNLGIYEEKSIYVGSCILTPIIHEGNLYGFIYIDSDKVNYFSSEIKEIMERVSKKISIMLKFFFELKENKIKSQRYKALFELARETSGQLEKKDIFEKIFKICQDVFEFDIFIFSQKKDESAEIVFIYDSKKIVRDKSVYFTEDSLFSFAYQNEYPVILKKIRREMPVINKENYGIRSGCFIPLKIGNDVKYLFALFSFFSENFTEDDKEILSFLQSQCEIVLEKSEIYEKEKERATRDSLTGLYNHRMFQELIEKKVQKAIPFTLAMLDVDDFKKLNDLYGHPKGDRVLIEISKILEEETKNEGFSARYGGEEFAICIDLPKYEGAKRSDEIRKLIEEWDFYIEEGEKVNLTVSFGVAGFPDDASKRNELIDKADKALYFAKRKGKNMVYIYEMEETGLF